MAVERGAVDLRPGFFGKLPILGDFVSRRLSNGFIGTWDGWLQRSVLLSKERLGEDWLNTFLGAPMWRFLLAPGVVSDEAWLGVLVPSVDRVGRYFPLTIAAPIVVELDPVKTFWSNSLAFVQFEDLALMALDLHLDFDDFETRVSSAATPLVVPMKNTEDTTTPLPQETPRCYNVAVVGEWGDPDVGEKLQSRILGIRQPYCVWAKEGETPEDRAVLCTERLPPGEAFCAMLDLEWEQHGWQCLP